MLRLIQDRKSTSVILVTVLVSVLFIIPQFRTASAEDDNKGITIHYPPDKAVMEFSLLGISMELPEGAGDLIVAGNNDREIIRIVPDQTFECFSVPLRVGVNIITIKVLKEGSEIFDSQLSVFRRSDLESQYTKVPQGYKKDNFHMKDFPQCIECHKLTPGEGDNRPISPYSFVAESLDTKKSIASASTCYSCHKRIATTYPYVHGPVAVWGCLSCHRKDADPRYSVKTPDSEMCFECHKEQKNAWDTKPYTHGPVTIGKCTICHSPHASEYRFNLYKPTWNLCVNCHVDKGSGKHVLGDSFSTEGHPTRDRPDPIRIGKELSCASCHDPHASNYRHLWAFEADSIFELCRKCHYDK